MNEELPIVITREETQQEALERVPAPSLTEKKSKKKDKKFRWWQALIAVGLSAILFLSGYLVCWASLDSQLFTLMDVKKRIQSEYYTEEYEEITDEIFYSAVFGGINDRLLNDGYSGYMTPEEYAAVVRDLEGNRSGVGLVFTTGGEEELRVTRVCGNSPAEAAGLLAGDILLACGRTEGELMPCATFDEFSAILETYAEREPFYLKVRSGESERVFSISKEQYVENYVFYRTKERAYTFTGTNASVWTEKGEPMPYLDGDTAYIRLIQFTGNAAQDFNRAMRQFKEERKKHLILDLRENGGGYLDTMQSIAKYFCKSATEEKPVVAIADYGNGKTEAYTAPDNVYDEYFSAVSRIYVLADSGSASASECLIGCMLDYGTISYSDICLAERQGKAKTFGKGIMQVTYVLDVFKGDALKLTTAGIKWPLSKTSIHKTGITPDHGALTVEENRDFEIETQNAVEKLLANG